MNPFHLAAGERSRLAVEAEVSQTDGTEVGQARSDFFGQQPYGPLRLLREQRAHDPGCVAHGE